MRSWISMGITWKVQNHYRPKQKALCINKWLLVTLSVKNQTINRNKFNGCWLIRFEKLWQRVMNIHVWRMKWRPLYLGNNMPRCLLRSLQKVKWFHQKIHLPGRTYAFDGCHKGCITRATQNYESRSNWKALCSNTWFLESVSVLPEYFTLNLNFRVY